MMTLMTRSSHSSTRLAIKVLVIFLSLVLSSILNMNSGSAGIGDEGDYWGMQARGITGTMAISSQPALLSFLSDEYIVTKSEVKGVKLCGSFPSSDCPTSQFTRFVTPFGMCKDFKTDCIEEVFAESDGKKLEVKFVRYFPESTETKFSGNEEVNLPSSATTFLISIPGAAHAEGDLYLVSAGISGERRPIDTAFAVNAMEVAIWPVKIIKGNYPKSFQSLNPKDYSALGVWTGGGSQCGKTVQTTGDECAVQVEFPENLTLGLTIRLKTQVSGWLEGRMANADASIARNQFGEQIVTVSGKPVSIPALFGWVKKVEMPENLRKYYESLDPFWRHMGGGLPCLTSDLCLPKDFTGWLRGGSFSEPGMKELSLWLPILNDKAATMESSWYFKSVNANIVERCAPADGTVTGLVTTNATIYLPGPPTFDSSQQSLDYKVLAPHFRPDGDEFRGTYDLIIDAQVARCIYGYSSAPISASISLISESGINQVVASQVSEKNGFLRMSVQGFTFSNPTLRVKLKQASQDSKLPSNPSKVSPSGKGLKTIRCFNKSEDFVTSTKCPSGYNFVIERTITCKNGSSIRKVLGQQPVCPRGYKKVSTSIPKFSVESGIKIIWCIHGTAAIQVAGIKPGCPTGMRRL